MRQCLFIVTLLVVNVAFGQSQADDWTIALKSVGLPPTVANPGLMPLGVNPQSHLWEFEHQGSRGGVAESRPQVNEKGEIQLSPNTGIIFVLVPGGKFEMGGGGRIREQPFHEVSVAPFFISKYECTQAQWERLTGKNPSEIGDESTRGTLPVEHVSHEDCVQALPKWNLGLPTESQWEYACHGGNKFPFGSGEEIDSLMGAANLAHERGKTKKKTFAVGSLRPNGFGLHDMHGNVDEWCLDTLDGYWNIPRVGDGYRRGQGTEKLHRGGNWASNPLVSTCSARRGSLPNVRTPFIGLRPVLLIPELSPSSRPTSTAPAYVEWSRAIAAISSRAESPAYNGLVIPIQQGLLPIGKHPQTGLWEFEHVASRDVASTSPPFRRADGDLIMTPETGIVMILVPAGIIRDPEVLSDEVNYLQLAVSPYFLSKFELTKSQWARISGLQAKPIDRLTGLSPNIIVPHDVYLTRLKQFGLTIPSARHWEYACRAGLESSYGDGFIAGNFNLYREDAVLRSLDRYPDIAMVGAFPRNPFGFHDIVGNVSEYTDAPNGDPVQLNALRHVKDKASQYRNTICKALGMNHHSTYWSKYAVFDTDDSSVAGVRPFAEVQGLDGSAAFAVAPVPTVVAKTDSISTGVSWQVAQAAITASDIYGGLNLDHASDLVPVGKDPVSNFWEFEHVPSRAVGRMTTPARGADGRLLVDESTGIIFVLVPKGRFVMIKDDRNYFEMEVHETKEDCFLLSKYELSTAQWRRMAGYQISELNGFSCDGREAIAIHHLDEAILVLSRFNLDLPSERQWEYACRAGTRSIFYTGNWWDALVDHERLDPEARWNAPGPPSRIGSFRPNAFGFHDMLGNLSEPCSDLHTENHRGAETIYLDKMNYEIFMPPTSRVRDTTLVKRGGDYSTAPEMAFCSKRDFMSFSLSSWRSRVGLRPMRHVRKQ